ncbi:DUF853 family protein [Kribbella sp. NBC_01510]|uniref:helicase HerA-like domain-containing protein n=1 Tax=Kribbella sp. NBC_01510 TaxID=2903581 RepID=UPI00386CCF9B
MSTIFDPPGEPVESDSPHAQLVIPDQHSSDLQAEVIEAELVDLETPATQQPANVPAVRQVTTAVVVVVRHDYTKRAVRPVVTVAQGIESWCSRAWDASTMGVYRRQIKAAEKAGDREALQTWVQLKEQATDRRWKRMLDLPTMLGGLLRIALLALVGIPGAVLLISILAEITGNGSFSGVWNGFVKVLGAGVIAVTITSLVLWYCWPVLLLYFAFREGQRRAAPPTWLLTERDLASTIVIDEGTIARALDSLRLKPISDHLKEGLSLEFPTPARVDGRGTHAVVRLPAGVTAEEVAKRRQKVAGALHRAEGETWLTVGGEAGLLDLWIADKGALAEGAGMYPLLDEGVADFFAGFPAGRTLRGDVVTAPMSGRNTITGGLPGQGKSSSARILMAGAALDPTCELRIYVPDSNFDFARFEPRSSRYVMGAERESIERIRDEIADLHAELQRRGRLLGEFEAEQVDRKLASKGVGLHPIVALFEECHVLFQDAAHGKEISFLMEQIVKLDRKRGVHVILSTQAPTATSIPRDVTRNCSNGVAFAVTDHVANDGLLGAGAYKSGHRATILRPGADIGTSVVRGFTGERSDVLQWFFVSGAKDNDQLSPVIKRSLAAVKGTVPGTGTTAAAVRRDLLEDLAEVLAGDEPVKAADVPALLRELAPDWAPYQRLNGAQLRDALKRDHGITIPSTDRKYPVSPAVIRQALAERE